MKGVAQMNAIKQKTALMYERMYAPKDALPKKAKKTSKKTKSPKIESPKPIMPPIRGWFAIEIQSPFFLKKTKISIESQIHLHQNEIFNVATPSSKDYGNYIFVDMINTPSAISTILQLSYVKWFLGSNYDPQPLSQNEFHCMVA